MPINAQEGTGRVSARGLLPLPKYMQPATPGGATVPTAPPPATDPNQGSSPDTSPIPGASVYLGQEAQADKAYQDAQAQLLAQRNTLYSKYGLDSQGAVDPNNQYGEYQMLLGSEGGALDSARDNSASRGLTGPGLGNQEESALRFQQGGEQKGFQQQVDQAGLDYSSGLTSAQQAKSQAYLDAENGAYQNSILQQLFNPAAQPTTPTTPPPSAATRTSQTAAAKKKLVATLSGYSQKSKANLH